MKEKGKMLKYSTILIIILLVTNIIAVSIIIMSTKANEKIAQVAKEITLTATSASGLPFKQVIATELGNSIYNIDLPDGYYENIKIDASTLYNTGYADGSNISVYKSYNFGHVSAQTKTYDLEAGTYIIAISDGRATASYTPSQTISGYDSMTVLINTSNSCSQDSSYASKNNLYIVLVTVNTDKTITVVYNASNHSSSACIFIGKVGTK